MDPFLLFISLGCGAHFIFIYLNGIIDGTKYENINFKKSYFFLNFLIDLY